MSWGTSSHERLWIALKFFVLLQSKQPYIHYISVANRCELLSNFLYFCSRNNQNCQEITAMVVVNCSQIFCTFAVETTKVCKFHQWGQLWIALKFFVLLQSKQHNQWLRHYRHVVNCSQIFCTFAVETTGKWNFTIVIPLWIALKFFVLLQSKQQIRCCYSSRVSCELLSNFLYFCSRNNPAACAAADGVLWIALKFFVLLQSKQL